MKSLKYDILFIILFMSIGIAAVSSNLIINGSTPIASNSADFNIYFANISDNSSDASENVVVSSDNQSFNFYVDFKDLQETLIINFDVINSSKNYDAHVTLSCTDDDEYLNVAYTLDADMIAARSSTSGEVAVNLIKSYIGDEPLIKEITCTINASAIEREAIGSGTIPTPTESYAMLKSTSSSDTSMFRSETYKEKIKNITIENKIDIPSDAIESWDIGAAENGNVMAYVVPNSSDTNYYDLYIQSDTQLYGHPDMSYWFASMTQIEKISNLNLLDTSRVTNMDHLFYMTGYNSSKIEMDLTDWNTSNVTNMGSMFRDTGFNSNSVTINVSSLDTGNVTNMYEMFAQTGRNSTDFYADVSNFNTSKVTNMENMFAYVGYKNPTFTIDVSSFETSNVTDMSGMFAGTGFASPTFTLDVSSFNTSKVTDMSNMFIATGFSNTSFNLDVSHFDTTNVVSMTQMFANLGYQSTKLQMTFTIRNPNTSSYDKMFYGAASATGSKIIVNYTHETEELVDKMIKTKTTYSNVVKGELVD